MTKHINKMDPQVRALAAWQDARALLPRLKQALRSSAATLLAHEITNLAIKVPELIERGHLKGLSGNRAEEISVYWKASSALNSLRLKVERAAAKELITSARASTLATQIETAQRSLAALVRMSEPGGRHKRR
jgi:hypothetical protein